MHSSTMAKNSHSPATNILYYKDIYQNFKRVLDYISNLHQYFKAMAKLGSSVILKHRWH